MHSELGVALYFAWIAQADILGGRHIKLDEPPAAKCVMLRFLSTEDLDGSGAFGAIKTEGNSEGYLRDLAAEGDRLRASAG